MSKKRKLKVKIKNKNKNKNKNIIHIKIDNSKKTKSRSNQNQKQHQPSIPNIIIQSPQTQPQPQPIIINPPQDNSYLHEMIRNSERRNSQIPITSNRAVLMNNTTQTEQPSFTNRLMTSANNALLNMVNNIDEPKRTKTRTTNSETQHEITHRNSETQHEEEPHNYEEDLRNIEEMIRNERLDSENNTNRLNETLLNNSRVTVTPLTTNKRIPHESVFDRYQSDTSTPRRIDANLNEELRHIDEEKSEELKRIEEEGRKRMEAIKSKSNDDDEKKSDSDNESEEYINPARLEAMKKKDIIVKPTIETALEGNKKSIIEYIEEDIVSDKMYDNKNDKLSEDEITVFNEYRKLHNLRPTRNPTYKNVINTVKTVQEMSSINF